MSRRYVVVTPVRDEEHFLPSTIHSILAQTERPVHWVIVDDGSTDQTPAIAREAASRHAWITVHTMPPRESRVLGAGVVQAFKAGLARIDLTNVDFISKLDADLELHPKYFSLLMDRMEQDPRLGIASGQAWVRDPQGREVYERGAEEMSIGQAKFYRTQTFEDIGGLAEVLAWDGIDSHEARTRGWRSRAFADPELRVMTLRPEGASDRSVLRGRRRRGRGLWILGSDPLFMLASALLRVRDTPAVLGSLHTLYGYADAALTGVPRHGTSGYGTQVRRFQREALVLGKKRATRRFEERTAERWPGSARRAVGLLVSQHPTLSHTFIDREMDELRREGWQIHEFSLRVGHDVHRDGRTGTITIRQLPPRRVLRHALNAAAHPWALVGTTWEAVRPSDTSVLRPVGVAYLVQAVLLLGELRREKLSHVHVHFANNAAEVARLAAFLSDRDTTGQPISYSLSIHGLSMHGAASEPDFDHFPHLHAERWGSLRSKVQDAVFVRCVDSSSAQRVQEVTERSDIKVIHVGIDTTHFSGNRHRESPPVPFSVGFIGRLAPEKQIPLLLEAFAKMRRGPRRLQIVGAGPCLAEAQDAAARWEVADKVAWIGTVTQADLPRHLASFDVLAMSSSYEGTPVVLMEAMASGVPVVAPRVGGIPELVEDGVSGLLFNPNDAEELARALDRLGDDDELRQRLAVGGRARVHEAFNSRKLAASLDELFEGTMTEHRRRDAGSLGLAPTPPATAEDGAPLR